MGGNVRAIIDVTPSLQVLELPGDPRVLAFDQAGEPVGVPPSDDSLEEGDWLAVLADFDTLEDVHRIVVCGSELPTRR